MSKYTTELRFIIGSLAGSTDTSLTQLKKDIPKALPLIFDGDLSLDSPLSITTFETLFLNHFAFHEIGFETFARWKYEINNHLREIIPYYNDLSSSTTKEFSFFLTSPGYTDGAGQRGQALAVRGPDPLRLEAGPDHRRRPLPQRNGRAVPVPGLPGHVKQLCSTNFPVLATLVADRTKRTGGTYGTR